MCSSLFLLAHLSFHFLLQVAKLFAAEISYMHKARKCFLLHNILLKRKPLVLPLSLRQPLTSTA